jgi:hypothetical protein
MAKSPALLRYGSISGDAEISTNRRVTMVQQNMFPQDVGNGKRSQSTTSGPRASRLTVAVSRQAGPLQARTAQLEQLPQRDAHDNRMNPRSIERDSEGQPRQTVRLFGRVGRYFEVKQTPAGKSVATFSLAAEQSYKDDSGRWQKQTAWQRFVAWGETARLVGELIQKGARVRGRQVQNTRMDRPREQLANNNRTGGADRPVPGFGRGVTSAVSQ